MKLLTPRSILAGPILRRAEKDRVCIWLATDCAVGARGEIYDATDARTEKKGKRGLNEMLGVGETASIRLGNGLFVTLLEVRPIARGGATKEPFPFDRLLAYDIALWPYDRPKRGILRLAAFFPDSSINDPDSGIAYKGLDLPSFYLPSPDRRERNIVHGSCRKLHGEGGDAFGFVDWLLRSKAAAPSPDGRQSEHLHERPSALLLTGDQVYLDDVSGALVPAIRLLAFDLMGDAEDVPRGDGTFQRHGLASLSLAPRLLPLLTGDEKVIGNHLVTFGEMAALYVLSWHPARWPERWNLAEKKLHPKEVERLTGAKKAVPAIRRALANVPTYMMFDDHDVTDDWNFNEKWKTRVEKESTLGRRIITNALAAYWAFQAWGNDPDRFAPLRDVVQRGLADRNGAAGNELDRALLDREPWGFIAPTVPEVIFLDTRTHRRLDRKPGEREGRGTVSARLLDDEGLARFKRDAEAVLARSRDKILVFVAPSPIFNVRATERGNELVTSPGTAVLLGGTRAVELGPEFGDLELWADNPGGYIDIVKVLSTLPAELCIILSGDVHYGFAQAAAVFKQDETTLPRRISPRFLQLTSSALQNLHEEVHNALIPLLRAVAQRRTYLKLKPEIPAVKAFYGEAPQGIFVELNLLEADSESLDEKDKRHFPKMMIRQSNVGQLKIDGDSVRHTFHMRDFDQRRFEPPLQPSPRSPVVTYRLR